MVSHPETGSDSPIESDRDRGRDIYIYILKRNYVGFDPQWTRYAGDRLKSGSSPILFIKLCMELKKF